MNVQFIYQGSVWLPNQEKVSINLCKCVAKVIELPLRIEIEFAKLPPNVYGETLLFGRFRNRFRISDSLTPKEIVRPVVHELIHIHQVHTGKLKVMRDGTHIWMGRQYRNVNPNELSNADYRNLPWELDVENSIEPLLVQAVTKV